MVTLKVLTVGVGGTVGIPTDPHVSFDAFRLTIDEIDSDQFTGWSVGDWDVLDDFSNLFNGSRKRFPLKKGGNFVSFVARQGSNINIQDNLFIFLNDVLQVPGVGYEFSGGSQVLMSEAPDEGDSVKVIFYRGSSAVDTQDVDITETVKIGDSLDIDSSVDKLDEDPRTVQDVLTTNVVNTNAYNGVGLSDDEDLERPVKWCRQRDDIYLDGRRVSKARPLYEPSIFPAAYIIKSVGVGSTDIYVDNVRPSFNQDNESTVNTDFQKKLTIVNYEQKSFCSSNCSGFFSRNCILYSIVYRWSWLFNNSRCFNTKSSWTWNNSKRL